MENLSKRNKNSEIQKGNNICLNPNGQKVKEGFL